MNLDDKVKDVVESFCNDLESFTSLDVSNCVKQEGFSATRHRDIAQVVRYLYVDGAMHQHGYTRSLIQVQISSGMMRDAYLYHHDTVSPNDYDRRAQVAIPPASGDDDQDDTPVAATTTTRVVNSSQPAAQDDNDDLSTEQVRCNKTDGRLEVPVEWVRELDWAEGTAVYVVHEQDTLVAGLHDDVEDGDNVVATAHISHGRLRIPKTAFAAADFAHLQNNEHRMELHDNCVIIYDEENDDRVTTAPPVPTVTFTF